MADQSFAVPGSSYKELAKIIQGYAQIGKDATPSEVGALIGMHETQVSRSNKFLVSVGLVQGGRSKHITQIGSDLAHALEHNMTEEIAKKWREISEGSDFLQKALAAVRIRKGMDESSLEAHVAYSAGQPKTPAVMAGARTVVEILKTSGLLREEGGNLVAASGPEARAETSPPEPQIRAVLSGSKPPESAPSFDAGPEPQKAPRSQLVTVSVQVRVNCNADELDGLGAKLRNLFQQLSMPDKSVEVSEAGEEQPEAEQD